MMQIRRKLFRYFVEQNISDDFNACCTQCIKAAAGNVFIRIRNCRNNTCNPCGDNCFGARASATSMRTRLKGGIQGGTTNIGTSFASRVQRNNFSVWTTWWLSCTFIHSSINTHNDSTHPWIGSRMYARGLSHMHGTAHERLVVGHVVSLLPSGLLPSASESH